MRKLIFVLVSTLILIAWSMNAKAQSSYDTPYTGATHTYTIESLGANLIYDFYLMYDADTTQADAVANTATAGWGTYTYTGSASGTIGASGGDASVTITWDTLNVTTSSTDYYLVIRVKGTDNCPNYRILPIDVVPNPTDFDVWALGTSLTNPTDWSTTVANNATDCNVFINHDFDDNAANYSLGVSYVYFHVNRASGNDDSNWKFTFDLDDDTNVTAAVYSTSGGDQTNTTFNLGDEIEVVSSTSDVENSVLIRLTVTNTNAANTVNGFIGVTNTSSTAYEDDGTIVVPDGNYADVEADFQINPIPTIGGFTGN